LHGTFAHRGTGSYYGVEKIHAREYETNSTVAWHGVKKPMRINLSKRSVATGTIHPRIYRRQ